jgi:hypothetical protein
MISSVNTEPAAVKLECSPNKYHLIMKTHTATFGVCRVPIFENSGSVGCKRYVVPYVELKLAHLEDVVMFALGYKVLIAYQASRSCMRQGMCL